MISMFQQGGQLNDEQQAFTAYLIKILNPKDSQDFENKILSLSEDLLLLYYKDFKMMENKITFSKLGSKLNYIKSLRGECPEGYEVEKFMSGGCVKCRKKAQEGMKASEIFKDKCGGKAKKRFKKEEGGTMQKDLIMSKKCGGKAKKKK